MSVHSDYHLDEKPGAARQRAARHSSTGAPRSLPKAVACRPRGYAFPVAPPI